MMRVEDHHSREASTEYWSLETSRQGAEVDDVPVSKGWRAKKRNYAVSVCVFLVAIALVVSVTLVIGKTTGRRFSSEDGPQGSPYAAPAPGPGEYASSSPAPAVEGAERPVAAPLFSPLSSIDTSVGPAPVTVIDPGSLDLAPYETICNKTINRVDCLNVFRSNPNAHGGDLKQWTVTAMEAAERAVNESYILAQGMQKENEGNVALQQCIDVFGEALGNVNISMFLVSTMDSHNPGKTGEDVQTFMSAAMTDYDTCGEGIDDVGPFPGSDKLTGQQAKHVDTMLSIALTFVNHLIVDENRYHHRRLLHIVKSTEKASFSEIGQVFPR